METEGQTMYPLYDFEDYSIQNNTLYFRNKHEPADIAFSVRDGVVFMGIILGEKQKWFELTEDAKLALQDLLEGRDMFGGAGDIFDRDDEEEAVRRGY